MRELAFFEALGEAIKIAMEKNPLVFTYGEDIAKQGGIFGAYKSLIEDEKLKDRVIDTPISEEVIYGSAVGAALAGAVPIVEYHFADFLFTGMCSIVNQIMKIRYMSGGQAPLHIILRGPDGIARAAAAHHSQSIETIFMHVPGIKVAIPSTPYDVKGLMLYALLKNKDPVIFFEHKRLYKIKGPVPEGEYYIPFGKADIKREGKDVTVVATSRMVHEALKAAEELEREGISVEVIDLRTLVPWDRETVINSVKKTNRLVVAHETWKRAGWGAEIASVVQEEAFDYLDAPVVRVGAKNVPHPFAPVMEDYVVPDKDDIIAAVRKVLE